MSPEPPPSRKGRARPDTEFRRRALVAHGHGPPPQAEPEFRVGERESLQDELAGIPDLGTTERSDGSLPFSSPSIPMAIVATPAIPDATATPEEASEPGGERAGARRRLRDAVARLSDSPAPVAVAPTAVPPAAPAPEEVDLWGVDVRDIDRDLPDVEGPLGDDADDPDDPPIEPGGPLVHAVVAARVEAAQKHMARPVPSTGPDTRWWRRLGFAAVVLALVAVIPVLSVEGYRLVTNSTDGRFGTAIRSSSDPGYQEPVTPTPTALVMQTDASGAPVALAFLALSSADGGGSVILVPLETAVRSPAYGVDRIGRAYDVLKARPADGRKQVAFQVSATLNVGIDEVVELDGRRWAQLVEPFGGLTIENPDPVQLDGEEIPSGKVTLTPEQVGPFLAARAGEEGALNQMNRQALVWTAWLDAVRSAGSEVTLPGEQDSGIVRFATALAKGDVAVDPLPGKSGAEGSFVVDDGELTDLIVDAVPAPTSAYPGSRAAVRVLNGWAPEPIPDEVLRTIVHVQGSINSIGNGPAFGRKTSLIVYSDPADRGHAELLKVALGGLPTVQLDRTADDQVDLTLILGQDVIDEMGG